MKETWKDSWRCLRRRQTQQSVNNNVTPYSLLPFIWTKRCAITCDIASHRKRLPDIVQCEMFCDAIAGDLLTIASNCLASWDFKNFLRWNAMDFQWTGEREETLLNTLPTYHHRVTKDMLMSEICKEIGCDRKSFHEIVFLCTMHFLLHRFFAYVVPYVGFDWWRVPICWIIYMEC